MNKLFWGFFLIYLDFNLNFGASTLQLLPDWLGFVLLYIACVELLGESELFQRPQPFCAGLAIYSAIAWLVNLTGFGAGSSVLWWVLALVDTALTLYVNYLVIDALANVEMRRNYDLCTAHLRKVWMVLAVATVSACLLMIVPQIAVICVIAAAVAGIFFLVAIHGTRKAWRNMMDEQSLPL